MADRELLKQLGWSDELISAASKVFIKTHEFPSIQLEVRDIASVAASSVIIDEHCGMACESSDFARLLPQR